MTRPQNSGGVCACLSLIGRGAYSLIQCDFVFVQEGELIVDHGNLGLRLGHAGLKSLQEFEARDEIRQSLRATS